VTKDEKPPHFKVASESAKPQAVRTGSRLREPGRAAVRIAHASSKDNMHPTERGLLYCLHYVSLMQSDAAVSTHALYYL